MKAASRARLCLPLPPTPTSSAFPRGDSRIRFIWQLHVEVQTVSCRRKCVRDKETDSWNQKQCILSISFLSSLYHVSLSFRYSCKNAYQTLADTKCVNSVRFFHLRENSYILTFYLNFATSLCKMMPDHWYVTCLFNYFHLSVNLWCFISTVYQHLKYISKVILIYFPAQFGNKYCSDIRCI